MIPTDKAATLMRLAITEAKLSTPEDHGVRPFVGAVVADENGEVIATAHRAEQGSGDHAEYIVLSKANLLQHDLARAELFVTLEPCTARSPGKKPCAQHIVESGIRRVHIGMLDPNGIILGRGEDKLRQEGIAVERFPSELVGELEILNEQFVRHHREVRLPDTSLYVSTQVCDIILEALQREGLPVKELPHDWDVSVEDLINYCRAFDTDDTSWDIPAMIRRFRGLAFDKKYADYTYEKDARGLIPEWIDDLNAVLTRCGLSTLEGSRVINVGIGNGAEGHGLLEKLDKLTLVDVGSISLQRAQQKFPRARATVSNAENLDAIRAKSQDVYMSLRTYQSSYFDVTASIREAYRVLRAGGLFIASVANAFLGEDETLVPGLVFPRSNMVDRDRPFEVAEKIRHQLTIMGFDDVGLHSGRTEVFVFGKRPL